MHHAGSGAAAGFDHAYGIAVVAAARHILRIVYPDGCGADGTCTHTPVAEGTLCSNKTGVCHDGHCGFPTYLQDIQPILKTDCKPCHTANSGCAGNACFAVCYDEAVRFTDCGVGLNPDPYPSQPMYSCIAARVSDRSMPANGSCGSSTPGPNCPTDDQIALIRSWSQNGHLSGGGPACPSGLPNAEPPH